MCCLYNSEYVFAKAFCSDVRYTNLLTFIPDEHS